MKKNKGTIAWVVISIILASWWYFTYNYTRSYSLYSIKDGVVDTTRMYMIAPRYTKKVLVGKDTNVLFFNKDKEFVISINRDSLINYIIKK